MSVTLRVHGRFDDDGDLNLSNQNFRKLMDLLDVPVDGEYGLCGIFNSGPQLVALQTKVIFALKLVRKMPELDRGTETVVSTREGYCTFIECGWAPGYLESRLSSLLALIEAAVEEGVGLVYA